MTARPDSTTGETRELGARGEGSAWRWRDVGALPDRAWIGLLVLLALWVAQRIGLFDLWASVATAEGTVRLPDAFAGVDHPFHAVRAETLRRALAEGHPLRWVGHHQGGYPVEFYPLGVAWLEVGLWALLLGALPMAAVHKLTVGLIFLLPGLAYSLMARRDRWPLGVALAALAAHVAVPGGWEHGGYTELVQWGLVTNVAAAVALLFVLPWLTAYLEDGRGWNAAGAALAAAFAVSTNPRSLIALATIGAGAWLAVAARPAVGGASRATVTRRLALVAAVTAALAAPELAALLRFADLYDFVHYERYDSFGEYLRAAADAVSPPVLALGVAGALVAWTLPGRAVTRAAATTLGLYVAVTFILAAGAEDAALVPQLEATRLMPFQRLLTLYLAAVALHLVLRRVAAVLNAARSPLPDALLLGAILALLVAFVAPADAAAPTPAAPPVPPDGLYSVATTAVPEQAAFLDAVDAADAAAPPGTAILVLGSALSWHQQLWAPLRTDRPLFYDDWLWYWHPLHAGPPGYAFRAGHHYPAPELALTPEYLARHGIGAVVVTGRAQPTAAASTALNPVLRSESYDVYSVSRATTVVTLDGENAEMVELDDQRLAATGSSVGGTALVRHNWYPRWRATVNGRPAPITRTAEGYMSVSVPAGEVRIELVYGVDRLDWLARALSALGFVGGGWLALGRRLARAPRFGPAP